MTATQNVSEWGNTWTITKELVADAAISVPTFLAHDIKRQAAKAGYRAIGEPTLRWIDNDDGTQVVRVEYEPGLFDPPLNTWTIVGTIRVVPA